MNKMLTQVFVDDVLVLEGRAFDWSHLTVTFDFLSGTTYLLWPQGCHWTVKPGQAIRIITKEVE